MGRLDVLEGFAWGEPLLLTALVAPLLAVFALRSSRVARARARALLGGPPGLRGGTHERRRLVVGVLMVLALALAVLAAARPQWGAGDRALEQRGIDLVIALDVSRSMQARDVAPTRAEAAATGLAEMLTHLTGNRVGLVVFAGSAFERAPLTVDLPVLATMVARAQNEAPLVSAGTDLAAAIEASLNVLDVPDRARTQAVLLVSDGEDLQPRLDQAIGLAIAQDVRVYTVFAATTAPTPLGDQARDVTTARPDHLEEIAARTGGASRGAAQVAGLAVEFRRLQQTQFAADTEPALIERFPWFVGGALLLLTLALLLGEGGRTPRPRLRRGVIGALLPALLGAVLLGACGAPAWRHVEDGNRAYEAGRFEEALAAYLAADEAAPDDPAVDYNIANALHRLRRMEEAGVAAAAALAGALDAEDGALAGRARFTLGNTAFEREQWEVARDSYMAALRLDPDDRDAKANLELVLAVLQPPPEDPAPQGEDGDPGAEDPEAQPGDGAPGEPDPGEGEGSEGSEGSEGEGEDGQPGDGQGDGPGSGETPGDPGTPQPGGPGGALADTLEGARAALEEALGALGPEVTEVEARRILELARRANELDPLPDTSGGGPAPR